MKAVRIFVVLMALIAVSIAGPAQSAHTATDVAVFKISQEESNVKFHVDSSAIIEGAF